MSQPMEVWIHCKKQNRWILRIGKVIPTSSAHHLQNCNSCREDAARKETLDLVGWSIGCILGSDRERTRSITRQVSSMASCRAKTYFYHFHQQGSPHHPPLQIITWMSDHDPEERKLDLLHHYGKGCGSWWASQSVLVWQAASCLYVRGW